MGHPGHQGIGDRVLDLVLFDRVFIRIDRCLWGFIRLHPKKLRGLGLGSFAASGFQV